MPSVPGVSDGCWMYAPAAGKGTVVFPSVHLPQKEGVYCIRYHAANSYRVAAERPLILTTPEGPSQ